MDFDRLRQSALGELVKAEDLASLERWRIKFLGRKSDLALFLRSLAERSPEERRRLGKAANNLRVYLEAEYEKRQSRLGPTQFSAETVDISQPGKKFVLGRLHPLTITLRRMIDIFTRLGFETIEGPEIETEYYNFDALNLPPWHPARDLWDTFWLKPSAGKPQIAPRQRGHRQFAISKKLLLRTHTSPMQIRYMETHQPPFRIIVPGRVFRHEATDARHDMDFFQVEGLMVGPDVSFANFKWVMEYFLKQFFGSQAKLKLRPSYFPFTEPSFEILMACVICAGKGKVGQKACRVCGGEKWLEMGGAGMVHPQVFRNVGYNPEKVQGFAFGLGPDRFAMIKYKIDDIRLFRSGDLRFIKQF